MIERIFNQQMSRGVRKLAATAVRRRLAYPADQTALLLVGIQDDLFDSEDALRRIDRLAAAARSAGLHVFWLPARGAGEGLVKPHGDDNVLPARTTLSAFAGSDLAKQLTLLGVDRVIVAGAHTDVEVDSTARDAVELGMQATVVRDCCVATSTRNEHATLNITLPRIVHGILTLDELLPLLVREPG
ncbi:MAG: cysteine hydrolase [Thermoleophilaceae bacterium]|nr:cysteine hydrolase [Thermoleophilaceae bacterium]